MKTVFILFLNFAFALSIYAQQDTVANGDFEDWGTNPFYDEADNWTTLNALAQVFGAELAYQTTDPAEVYAGSHSIKLVTTNLTGVGVTPSILTNGVVNAATQNVEDGVEISSRPLALDFAYRFDPVGNDSAIVSITLTKWDQSNGTETVGYSEVRLASTGQAWITEQLVVEYTSQETPDTALILFTTGDDINPQVGTELFIDEVSYAYSLASTEDAEEVGLTIYPNPTKDILRFSTTATFQPATFNVFSIDGRFVKSIPSNGATLDLSTLKTGFYLLEIIGKNGQVVKHRFVKE